MPFTTPRGATVQPRWRDVYLAAGGRGLSLSGDFLAATALVLTLQTRGDHGYGVAGLLIAETVPLALLAPIGGRLADRVDSRLLIVATASVQAAVCTVLAYTRQPAMMIALVALLACGAALTQPTLGALVPAMVGREHLPKASAIGQTFSAVGMLAGPALGGLLVGAYGARTPLLIDAASYLAVVAAGFLIRTRRGGRPAMTPAGDAQSGGGGRRPDPVPAAPGVAQPGPAPSAGAVDRPDGEPARAPWRLAQDRLLMITIIALASVIAAASAVNVVEVFFVRETLGASATTYGLISASWTLGMLAGTWPFSRVRGDDHRLVLVQVSALAALSAVVLASAGVRVALWIIPLYLIGGGLNAGLNVLVGVVVGRRAPAHLRGRVNGVLTGAANGATTIGYLLGGLLLAAGSLSPRTLIAGTGLVSLALALGFVGYLWRGGRRATQFEAVVAQPAMAVGYGEQS